MKFTIMLNMSRGNTEVGDMWIETKIFDESNTLKNVFEWVQKKGGTIYNSETMLRTTIQTAELEK